MKKIIIAASLLALFAGCQCGDDSPPCGECRDGQAAIVEFSFGAPEPGTRTLIDDAEQTWPHEKQVNMLTLYIYGPQGEQVDVIEATDEEISEGCISFRMPAELTDTQCTVYAVANTPKGDYTTESQINSAKISNNVAAYLGTVDQMRESCQNPNRFLMSGKATFTVTQDNQPIPVAITLVRAMAKVVLRIRISPEMTVTHGFTEMVISGAEIGGIPSMTYVMAGDGVRTASKGVNSFSYDLTPRSDGDWAEYLCYLHECDRDGDKYKCVFKISCYFRAPNSRPAYFYKTYEIPVNNVNPDVIERNKCYRITGEITGLGYTKTDFRWKVAPWVPVSGQDINIGG